jgi:hypothetical protein
LYSNGLLWENMENKLKFVNIEGVDVKIKKILKCTVRYLFGIEI